MKNRQNKIKQFVSLFGLFCIATLIGAALGEFSLLALQNFPFGEWQPFTQPQAKAVALLSYEYPNLFIQFADGNIYSCQEDQNTCAPASDQLPITSAESWCGSPGFITPPKPDGIIDSVSTRGCATDGYVDLHFILLEDGSIWLWEKGYSAIGSDLLFAICGASGAFLGMIVGTATIIIVKLRTKE